MAKKESSSPQKKNTANESSFSQKITGIVLGVLNMDNGGIPASNGEKPLSGLLQEFYDEMLDAKKSVTFSMASVGMKRKKLRDMLDKKDAVMAQARHFEANGNSDVAKRLLGQALAMDEAIEVAAKELETQDTQAKAEILHFKELEKKVEAYKGKIQAAEQMERFNKLREQMTATVSQFGDSIISQIDSRMEQIEMRTAQLAAEVALDSERVEDMMLDSEVRQTLAQEKLEREYVLLQTDVKAGSKELPTAETTILLENSPTDKARLLLGKPAFDGVLVSRR